MSLSTNQSIIRGTFTSDGASEALVLPWIPTKFIVNNITQYGSAAAATPVMRAEKSFSQPDNSVLTYLKTNGAATLAIPTMNLTGGVSIEIQTPGALQTGTAITNADPAIVTVNAHGYKVGDVVRLTQTTGMLQIAGTEYTIQAVGGANVFQIGLDASGYAAPATAVTVQRIPFPVYFPRVMIPGAITQATQAVIDIPFFGSITGEIFSVGQTLKLVVPPEFGMIEADGQTVEVVATSTANQTITVDLDTTSFTAFAYPTSAIAAAGINFPQIVPIGAVGAPTEFGTTFNENFVFVTLGTNAIGGANDIMEWEAQRSMEYVSPF